MAGILVGIGIIANISSGNKYIGAMLFSLALLSIVQCELLLYTGIIGFAKIKDISSLLKILFFNLCGVSFIVFTMAINNNQFINSMIQISKNKFHQSIVQMFIYAFLCGILMFIAVYCKNKVITIFCIMTFILSGFEHCIADFPYLLININVRNIVKFIFIILGNSLGSIIAKRLIINKGSE